MKRTGLFLLMIILIMGVLSGCSSDTEPTDVESNTEIVTTDVIEKVFPDRKSEVYGVVQTIIGNELTINLVASSGTGSGEINPDAVELTEEKKAAKQAANQAAGGSGKSGGITKEIVLSGESTDVIIPIGTPLYMGGTTDAEPIQMEIADIMNGSIIKVWLLDGGEGDVNLAEFAQVITR
jgi:hypothetical protein